MENENKTVNDALKEIMRVSEEKGYYVNVVQLRMFLNGANTQLINISEFRGEVKVELKAVGGSQFCYPQVTKVEDFLCALPHILMTEEECSEQKRALWKEMRNEL